VTLLSLAGEAAGWDEVSRAELRRLRDAAAGDPGLAAALLRVVSTQE